MRGRLTAMPLAKSRKATRIASMQSAHRQQPLHVVVGDDDGHVWLRSLAPFRRAGNLSPGCRHWQCPRVRLGSATSIAPGKDHAMTDDFEDHCWKDVISPEVLEVYACYQAQDIRRAECGAAGDRSLRSGLSRAARSRPHKLAKTHPNSCGEYAHAAIEPTKRLFAAARAAGLPIFYSTGDTRDRKPAELRHRHQARRPPVDPVRLRDPAGVQAAAGRRGHHQAARQRVLRHAADRASDPARHPDADRLRRKHVRLRARDRGRCLFQRLPRRAGRGMLLRPQRCSRTRSTCSTCITNTPT